MSIQTPPAPPNWQLQLWRLGESFWPKGDKVYDSRYSLQFGVNEMAVSFSRYHAVAQWLQDRTQESWEVAYSRMVKAKAYITVGHPGADMRVPGEERKAETLLDLEQDANKFAAQLMDAKLLRGKTT